MTMRLTLAVCAAVLLAPLAVHAQDQGSLCQQNLQQTQDYVDNNRASLSAQARRDAERRLEVARNECNGSPQIGQSTLSALQRDLGMEASQTAQTPGQGREAGQ